MGQALESPPKTRKEYWREKGPVPVIAIALALCILLAFICFFLPVFTGEAGNQ